MARVSVIIPHYDDLDNLKLCLAALERQTLPREEIEIILADNNSSIERARIETAARGIALLISVAERGAGPARNAGVAVSTADFLAFVDSDCRPDPRWLEEGLAALETADVAGGPVRVTLADPENPDPAEAFEAVFAFRNERYIHRHGYSVTANLFVRRSAFAAIGGFRSGVSEDLEWGRRAAARGHPVRYAALAEVAHPARRNWPELAAKFRRITREAYALARERRFGRARWFARSWIILLSPCVHVFRALSARELPSIRSRFGAAQILFRIRAFRFIEANRLLLADIAAHRKPAARNVIPEQGGS